MTSEAEKPSEHRKAERKVSVIYRALRVIARRQTKKLVAQAKRIAQRDGRPSDLKPVYAKELKAAIKHAMVQAFKEGRRAMKKKIAVGLKAAPASVKELWDPGERILAAVRELDADVLKYEEVAAEYERWADEIVGGRLKETVETAREIISEGIKQGVPWNDYGWDKELGRNTMAGLKSQLDEVFDGYETWQLQRVAVTEHTRAVGLGDIYEIDRDEMCVGGRWIVEYKGCEICSPRDGRVYSTAWLRANHPGHPSCYCGIDPVFKWEKVKLRNAA